MKEETITLALPFFEIELEENIIYGENHFIKLLIDSPYFVYLLFANDLGFEENPNNGFRFLSKSYKSSEYIIILKEKLRELYKSPVHPIFPGFKDTVTHIFFYIFGIIKRNKDKIVAKYQNENINYLNSINYIKNILKIKNINNMKIIGEKWLNISIEKHGSETHIFIINKYGEKTGRFKVLEILASRYNSILHQIISE